MNYTKYSQNHSKVLKFITKFWSSLQNPKPLREAYHLQLQVQAQLVSNDKVRTLKSEQLDLLKLNSMAPTT